MKIALLTADIGNPMPNVGDFFITEAIQNLFIGHDCTRFPLHVPPNEETFSRLAEQDVLIICGSNLIGINGSIRCAYEPEDFLRLSRPVVALGVGSQADLGQSLSLDARARELLKIWSQGVGTLYVRDELTKRLANEVLGESAVHLSGCPSLLWHRKSLAKETFPIFCFGPYHYEPAQLTVHRYHRLSETLHRRLTLGKNNPCVTLVQEPSDFKYRSLTPNDRLFYSPRSPELHLELLSSASQVVSFRIDPCLVAAANSIPCVVLCLDERTKSLSELLSLPHIIISGKQSVEEIYNEVIRLLESPQNNLVQERIQHRVENFRAGWGEIRKRIEKLPGSAKASAPIISDRRNFHFCSITDRSFLVSVVGLIENIGRFHPEGASAHILCLDKTSWEILSRLKTKAALFLYTLEEVWGNEACELQDLEIPIQAYRSKPRLVQKILGERGETQQEGLWFVDADVIFLRDPAKIEKDGLASGSVLLFPHWNDDAGRSRRYGLFNSGLFQCRSGAEAFLGWWAGCTEQACEDNPEKGHFFEQGYLDLAPLLFPEVTIHRGQDENVGHWAFGALGVKLTELGELRIRGGQKIGSFHAVGSDPLGAFEKKSTWDQLCILENLIADTETGPHVELRGYQQAAYSSRIRRILFLYHFLKFRLGVPLTLRQSWLDWGGAPPFCQILACLAFLYSKARDLYRILNRRPPYHPSRWLEVFRSDEVATPG